MAALKKVPVHIITGFLGSGKTTLIHSLLEQKPVDETWAILVNEFGQIGIDQAMFDHREDVVVKGLPGGCLCCQLSFVLQAALINLLARSKPDRVIIEPSGLGHPAGLLDLLRGEAFQDVVDVHDIIATLDPRRLDEARVRAHETFQDQLAMADAVVITMREQSAPEQLENAQQFANALWPTRKWIHHANAGQLPISRLLNSGKATSTRADVPVAHQQPTSPPSLEGGFFDFLPPPGKPQQETASALGYTSTGVRWHPSERFDLDRLAAWLGELPAAARVKGVFHTDSGWKRLNRADGKLSVEGCAWRQDSRLEVIVPDALATRLQLPLLLADPLG
ncbi:CobW family GTP-binding protein [Halomonas sp. GFAJ-1]|uniref:CobW family GTP-binding protein n=1 Tax=Halomonas sp. GFAJ-1 TaxID=1118153 RepID=UPI00023A4734|nr:GTP-binding protein [Halomonas sp. GFAJ-1]AVI62274.1 cobalamin biosynthesis protein P47K [Halomonas sp. GFAJ-1]EHK59669.1 cobalamin synthesis protein, P47K [Halomonas sp. GFAJ-1]